MILKNFNTTLWLIGLICMMAFTPSFANQEVLIYYPFEENGGNVIIDFSGNGNHASQVGTSWNSNEKFGTYSLDLDGGNDYITLNNPLMLKNNLSISIWLRPENDGLYTIYTYYGNQDLKLFFDSNAGNNLYLEYLTNSNTTDILVLDTTNFLTFDDYYHILLNINFNNGKVEYYRDNILIINTTIPIQDMYSQNQLRLFANEAFNQNEFNGLADSFRLMNFFPNESQRNQLFNLDAITLIDNGNEENGGGGDNDDNVTSIIEYDLINYTKPLSGNIDISESIEAVMNVQADCELYVDNQLVNRYYETLAFEYLLSNLEYGEHNYFVYCEKYSNNNGELDFEITPTYTFSILQLNSTPTFYVIDETSNNLLEDPNELYLMTPCLPKNQYSQYYIPENEHYIQKVQNGRASFNLSVGEEHEFCLVSGELSYKENGYSKDFFVNNVEKNNQLGLVYLTEPAQIFTLYVGNEDINSALSPEFWGQTWQTLFKLILALLVGGLIIGVGLIMNNEKVILAGTLVIAIGFGLSISTFIGGFIF